MDNLKTWEEMSVVEQYSCVYWDMYKDAYGVRPRGIDTSSWTAEDFQQEFTCLQATINRREVERRAAEASAIAEFEDRISTVVAAGARTRETAIRWIAEACNGDMEYLCFLNGLPYGYFRTAAAG